MNRSILIVICDFLLLSLLAFSTVDINKVSDQGGGARLQVGIATNVQPDITKDLTSVMRLALDEERKGQAELKGELVRVRDEASRQQALAVQREQQALALEQKAQTLAQRAQILDEKALNSEQKAIALQQELQARDRQVQTLGQKNQAYEQKAQALEQKALALAQQTQALDEKAQASEKKALVLQQELQARDRQVQTLDQKAQAAEDKALALQQELQARDRQVLALDEKTRASQQKSLALQRELEDRDRQVQAFKEELQAREDQALKLEQDRAALQAQFGAAQTNIATLNQQLKEGSVEGVLSREKLLAMEDQVRHQLEQSVALQKQMADLARTNHVVALEKERLSSQLQLAEAEKRFATGQVAHMQEEVKAEREERARLTDNIKVLASKQGEMAQEMREGRSMAPNAIFSEFATNRVDTQFVAVRAGLFGGESSKTRDTQTVLVTDGTNTFALCHVQETPLTIWQPGIDWEGLSGTLSRNAVSVPIRSLSFAAVDPRLVVIPVTAEEAHRLGCRVYPVCADPYKFQDAVLVGAREGYYGQCTFQIDLSTPDYVKLDRNVIKGLFGKFNPSRGDLVFSKAGELLGVMANSTYCLMLRHFGIEATFRFGPDGRGQRTGAILAALYSEVSDMPTKLQ